MRVICIRQGSGSIGAEQESVDNATAGMVVGLERQVNLTFTL